MLIQASSSLIVLSSSNISLFPLEMTEVQDDESGARDSERESAFSSKYTLILGVYEDVLVRLRRRVFKVVIRISSESTRILRTENTQNV